MQWKGPVARLAERMARKRRERIHPAVGLPMDAPDSLETENGSFVRVLPGEEHVPFLEARSRPYLWFYVLALAVPVCGVLGLGALALSEMDPGSTGFFERVGYAFVLLMFVSGPAAITLLGLNRFLVRKRIPRLLCLRRSRLFEPDEAWAVAAFEGARRFEAAMTFPDDFGVMSVGDGFVEFELSRAQVRIVNEDLEICVHTPPGHPGVGASFRCDIGEWTWSVTIDSRYLLHDPRSIKERSWDHFPTAAACEFLILYIEASGMQEREIRSTSDPEVIGHDLAPLVMTSERRSRRYLSRTVTTGAVIFFLFLACLAVWAAADLEISYPSFWICLGVLGLATGGAILWITRPGARSPEGTWRFSDDGVAFEPIEGSPVFIRWDEVERIRWKPDHDGYSSTSFEVEGRGIAVRMSDLDVQERDVRRARAFIERKLEPYFDLEWKKAEACWWKNVLLILGGLVLAALILIALAAALVFSLADAWGAMGPVGIFLYAIVVLCLLLPFVYLGIRNHREKKRLNPEWRERRSENTDNEVSERTEGEDRGNRGR